MYTALFLILLGVAVWLTYSGAAKKNVTRIGFGVGLAALTLGFFWFLGFWGEMLWFDALGYKRRFWKEILARVGMAAAGVIVGWGVVRLLTFSVPRENMVARPVSQVLGALVGLSWGLANWDVFLRYINSVSTGISDPILGMDTGFYLFRLPFYDSVYGFIFALVIISLIVSILPLFALGRESDFEFKSSAGDEPAQAGTLNSLYVCAAVLALVIAAGKYLDRFHLMYSTTGVVAGAGWTDVNVRLPAYLFVIGVTVIAAVIVLIPAVRQRFESKIRRANVPPEASHLLFLGGVGAIVAGLWIVALGAIPGLFQWLRVEPNEITFEKPYIAHNIEFTRKAFNLDKVEEREYPAKGVFTEQTVNNNKDLFANVRLWDYRALDSVYKQFQEIRLYYEFVDVDVDRYHVNDAYRQVMVSAREMELANLPEQSRTFVNRHFKYTHGYGLTLTTVNEFTPQGLPNLLVKDIPPVSEYESLEVTRPQIYYGELTRTYAVVNTKEAEFDYPKGQDNAYIRYPGKGGVPLTNLWRKFLFGYKFGGTRFFLTGYPTRESRIMFHRHIINRVRKLAPFLVFDRDPYVVLIDGKLYWIIDAYTTSPYYPYSEPFNGGQVMEYRRADIRTRAVSRQVGKRVDEVNYVRNSVKAVVDAFNGSVDFYIYEEDDPLIQVWDRIFPGLLKKKEQMPEAFQAHVRYPADMLLIQGLVYGKYHMTNPMVFYNQEDLWVRATEKYYGNVQPVEPYYIMWEPPDKEQLEFILMMPFTPKNRQVLIGWIAGMCDPENYGRFLAYKFPKKKRIIGPQQVETKIDQDRFLSGQLTLWDQRGSNVIRGNVLAIPVAETLFYVEPIYLQAETAAYPELRLVAVMHEDELSYAETFDEALKGLYGEAPKKMKPEAERPVAGKAASMETLIQRAGEAFENYLQYSGQKRFKEAAAAMEELQRSLEKLQEQVQPKGNQKETP